MPIDLGPLEIFFCWESVALSAGVHAGTRTVKSALLLLAKKPKSLAWAKHVAMPCVPLLLGALAATVLPLHPPWLMSYIERNEIEDSALLFFSYGGMIGVFADYIHSRVRSALKLKEELGPKPVRETES